MSMNAKEIIREFILDKEISERERKERFEIAWDIYHSFDDIAFQVKKELMGSLLEKMKTSEEFTEFLVYDDGMLSGKRFGGIEVIKESWKTSNREKHGILNYRLESDKANIHDLFIGIRKLDENKGIPFKGNWQNIQEPKSLVEKSREIYEVFYKNLDKASSSEWWIAWRYLDAYYCGMWEEEFYSKIVTKEGLEESINYIFDMFVKMKEATESLIDEFVEIYKRENQEV